MHNESQTTFQRGPSGPPQGVFAPNAARGVPERVSVRFFGKLMHRETTLPTHCIRSPRVETPPMGPPV